MIFKKEWVGRKEAEWLFTLASCHEGTVYTPLSQLQQFYCCCSYIVPMYFALEYRRQPIAVSDISVYICLIDIRDGSCKPVYGGVDPLQALSSAKTGRRSCFFMN